MLILYSHFIGKDQRGEITRSALVSEGAEIWFSTGVVLLPCKSECLLNLNPWRSINHVNYINSWFLCHLSSYIARVLKGKLHIGGSSGYIFPCSGAHTYVFLVVSSSEQPPSLIQPGLARGGAQHTHGKVDGINLPNKPPGDQELLFPSPKLPTFLPAFVLTLNGYFKGHTH